MAKKKSVTKSVAKKNSVDMTCECSHHDWHRIASLKLAAMGFILFLITVWPAAMNLVQSVHWGWFLAAWLIFAGLAFKGYSCCRE